VLSRSIGDREEEASMLQRLATVATWQADFDGARRLFSEAADALQAIGNLRGISHTLANQFVLAMRLGLLAEAEQLGLRVLDLVQRTGERRPLAVTKVNMSLNRLLQGDGATAKRLALEALEIARDIKFPLFVGAALSNLGNAERVTGDMDAGLKHLEEGLALRKPLLAPTDLLDDYCDLAVGYLQAGRLDDAIAAVRTLLEIAADSTTGAFWPHYCYWAAALVQRASRDESSQASLDRATTVMDGFAGTIADPATRAAFMALPLNREIVAASQRDEWPPYAPGSVARYTPVRRQKKK
jgi:tetratricopeptide (TPR) repeat protein